LFDYRNELLHTKRLLDARHAGFLESSRSFFIGYVSGNEHEPGSEFGPVVYDPLVNVGAIHSTRGPHIGNDSVEVARGEVLQTFGAGFAANDGIAIAFERFADKAHYPRFIFDQ